MESFERKCKASLNIFLQIVMQYWAPVRNYARNEIETKNCEMRGKKTPGKLNGTFYNIIKLFNFKLFSNFVFIRNIFRNAWNKE